MKSPEDVRNCLKCLHGPDPISDVDEGSTVTDFLPAERARGITIQSAAITCHWPPVQSSQSSSASSPSSNTINLIDTPGHADFTFEVIRSLRILDGAICILDGVAGVEAQTEKVWKQANGYRIPRLIYVNKLDRDGATFHRTVKEIALRLQTWPALCQIPWWKQGEFVGVGDVVNNCGLRWQKGGDGSAFNNYSIDEIRSSDESFAKEILAARRALIEALTDHDDILVDEFFKAEEDYARLPAEAIQQSLRRVLLSGGQKVTPVLAGASFRNIGVQPLLDAINALLPSPQETLDPAISLSQNQNIGLRQLLSNPIPPAPSNSTPSPKLLKVPTPAVLQKLTALGLAFKVTNDPRRGVLVYIRIYHGTLLRSALLYNTSLHTTERAPRLLHMYASDAVEVPSFTAGQIGVVAGLKNARTGDTLLVYAGASPKSPPPEPFNRLQLQPIAVPPPLFFVGIEPASLAEEKHLNESLALLLREDPSLSVSADADSGQTQLAGMGELHLEIARDRLLNDYRVKASVGNIDISYGEAATTESGPCTATFDREVAGKRASASCAASVAPANTDTVVGEDLAEEFAHTFALPDGNTIAVEHSGLSAYTGKPISPDDVALPADLPLQTILSAYRAGASAALSRGPTHAVPLRSTAVTISFDQASHLTPHSTSAALSSAARLAVQGALKESAEKQETSLMEPFMLASITVDEGSLGDVVHDLTSARGGHVLSLDAVEEADDTEGGSGTELPPEKLALVYAPPDPFGGGGTGSMSEGADGGRRQRVIKARVPLRKMLGYLKHLRSLTGGRGTFVMSVDRFERMSAQRVRAMKAETRGDFV